MVKPIDTLWLRGRARWNVGKFQKPYSINFHLFDLKNKGLRLSYLEQKSNTKTIRVLLLGQEGFSLLSGYKT